MEKGDVFCVAGREPMYITEAVAASGTVYARRFHLYQGDYGEPEAFQPNVEFEILFNAFKREHQEGCEYCEIVHAVDWANQTEWFEARPFGVEDKGRIAQTPAHHFIRGEPLFTMQDATNMKTHQNLVDKLRAEGWEKVIERRNQWFDLRLRRRKGFQVQKKSKGWFHNPFNKSS